MKTLIWSVAWGDYRYMTQALMNSIRNCGIKHDILTFSDEPISNVISCELDKKIELDFKQYWKFHYLTKVAQLNYDLFVFIDSDHYFVRNPPKEFSEIIGEDPWHSFLESPINAETTRRSDWWGLANPNMVKLYRDFGVNQDIVYNSNGGFWMCRREFANHASNIAFAFRDFQRNRGLDLPEEVLIAILSHMFSKDYSKRKHSNYTDIWASEWTGDLKDKIPDGSDWTFQEYMTHERKIVNPAIVHAMRSKQALVSKGKEILNSSNCSFVSWEQVKKGIEQ